MRLTGIDGWSWDAPFVHTAKKYAETKDASLIWEGHKAGRHIGYCHIEKLHNLEQLPWTGFTMRCLPYQGGPPPSAGSTSPQYPSLTARCRTQKVFQPAASIDAPEKPGLN